MYFEYAITMMKIGKKACREGWNGKDMFIFMIMAGHWDFETDVSGVDAYDTMPFICMKTADNKLVPWVASQTDILADDWLTVD